MYPCNLLKLNKTCIVITYYAHIIHCAHNYIISKRFKKKGYKGTMFIINNLKSYNFMKLDKIQKMSKNALEKLSEKSEFTIQCEIVSYARSIGLLIFSVPNEATRGEAKYKRSGVLAGVSDLVMYKDGIVWFIELKDYKGVQSEAQKEFESKVSNYILIRSLNEFRLFINK